MDTGRTLHHLPNLNESQKRRRCLTSPALLRGSEQVHCTMKALGTQCRSPEWGGCMVWTPCHHPGWGGVEGPNQTPATAHSWSRASVMPDLPVQGAKEPGRSLQALCSNAGRWVRAHRPSARQWGAFNWDFAAEGRAASPLPGRSAARKDGGTGLGLLPCGEVPFSQLAGWLLR